MINQPDSPVAEAILRTLLYADVFDFPMTEAEIHHFLIGFSASAAEVHAALTRSAWLARHIESVSDYYVLRSHTGAVQERRQREAASQALWPLAQRHGLILAHLPFVRMVALTGALSVRNADGSRDDIDYLLVTAPGRVWLARAMAVFVVRLARLWGAGLCPNYVLSETALEQSRQDLFVAHELAQMIPLSGFPLYQAMRAANSWADVILPNARGPFYQAPDVQPRGTGRLLQRIGERILGGRLGTLLERWEQRRKLRKFQPDAAQPGSAAELDADRVKGHFKDYGYPALQDYQTRLARYHLADSLALESKEAYGS